MDPRMLLTLCALLGATLVCGRQNPPAAFQQPPSDAVDHVDPYVFILVCAEGYSPDSFLNISLVGNGGDSPNGSGGMIPSTAPPFGMTRWVAQTRQNYVSVTPYNYTDNTIHGFQGTHQPAIWMGESGQVVLVPGVGDVKPVFEHRGMGFAHDTEVISPSYYSVHLQPNTDAGDEIFVEQSASKSFV
jgi:hypothetical protein